jgi:hypothetical protein
VAAAVAAARGLISIQILYMPNFNTYNIYYSGDGGTSYSYYDVSSSSAPIIENLDANTKYIFKLVPNGAVSGFQGLPAYYTTSTKPIITEVTATTVDSSNITITVSGAYDWFDVSYSQDDVTYTTSNKEVVGTTTQVLGLTANVGYYFKIKPYGGNLVAYGDSVATSTQQYTLATVNTPVLTAVDISSVTITVDGTYTNAYIYNTTTGVVGTYSYNTLINGITHTDLSANTSYTYYVYAINYMGIQNPSYLSATSITYPDITDFTVNSSTSSSITFNITGHYSSAIIYHGETLNSTTYSSSVTTENTGIQTTFTISSNLYPNVTNYFTITPYNNLSVFGESSSTSHTIY